MRIDFRTAAKSIAVFLLWALLFCLVYAPAPLYTSNENQYFLRGMANAGYGFLNTDWFSTTRDSTPLFSWLIEGTYRLFGGMTPVYLYYALLMGLYLYSMAGICGQVFDSLQSRTERLLFFTLVLLVHSAALRALLSFSLGEQWKYLLEGGVAGQRIFGEAFQPSVFAVFLLLSICLFLRRKPYLAVLSLALAAAMHPTYLLTAGWITLAYCSIIWFKDKSFKNALFTGLTALVLVLPVLYYTYNLFAPHDLQLYQRTRHEMVYFRIPHHALVSEWFNPSVIIALLLILAALYLARSNRLFWVMLVLLVSAVGLTLVQLATGSITLALMFPWRASILLVPLSTCLLLAYGLDRAWGRWGNRLEEHRRLVYSMAALMIIGLVIAGLLDFRQALLSKQNAPEMPLYRYVEQHARAGQVYIIPLGMQDFRLETGVPVMADFKSIPYQEGDFAEWLGRVHRISYIYRQPGAGDTCDQLDYFRRKLDATHIVLPQTAFSLQCDRMAEIYNDGEYAVRQLLSPIE